MANPHFTIITPTVLRQSLLKCCESVNAQSCSSWEHLVIVDCEISNDVLAQISHPQRQIFRCEKPHRNWGHTCRFFAYEKAKGDYLYYLDDDNYLADPKVLETLQRVTQPWAIFPILRLGERFFSDPPARGKSDTGSFIVKREFGQWSNTDNYDTDGFVIENLFRTQPYEVILDRPLMVMPETHVPGAQSVEVINSKPRISIFTPVNNNTYLREAYESIKDQDFYEWILVFNNGGIPTNFGDARVKVHTLYRAPEKVGTVKAYACEQATGDVLLELDCDDLLMPDAVAEVQKAFEDPEVGFVYSNTLQAMGDLQKRNRFTPIFGWQYRDNEYQGHPLDELVAFPPTPEALSKVWFGPDHLRAFRRSVYRTVGGHDPAMQILDDSDLVCRMYLATKFVHLDKGLYVYRVHGENSWLRFNKDIQEGVYRIYDKYIYELVDRWAQSRNLSKIEMGNPIPSVPGYTPYPLTDLKNRWPIRTSSVGVIRSTDALCMLKNPIAVMKEISRVLVPGGWLFCQVPSTDGRGAFQDPRHITFFNENSFLYYTDRTWAQYIGTPVRFQSTRLFTTPKNDQQVCWTVAHLINLKDGYRPCGLIEI